MKKVIFLILSLIACFSIYAQNGGEFYYYKGERCYLNTSNDSALVYFNKNEITETEIASRYHIFNKMILDEKKSDTLCAYIIDVSRESISFLKSQTEVWAVEPVFEGVTVANVFFVKLSTKEDTTRLRMFAESTQTTVIGAIPYCEDWYSVETNKESGRNVLSVCNYFWESGYFADVSPCFIPEKIELTRTVLSDDSIGQQWGLGPINAFDAWNATTGDTSIRIAIIDGGVYESHPEFIGVNIADSYNSRYGTHPAYQANQQATMVGGVIFANHNYGSIAGIAPGASMMNISIPLTSETLLYYITISINYAVAHNANIIYSSLCNTMIPSPFLENAIENAIAANCLLSFPSGLFNHNPDVSWNDDPDIKYPAYTNKEFLVVGGADINNSRSTFSCYGYALDVVAPGENILSCNAPGCFPIGNYLTITPGAHLAAALVSGVAALMLSVNPDLTAAQVARIIKGTAQKVGGYNYAYSADHLNGTWHEEMGHGLVDAAAAVTVAASSTGDLSIRDNTSDNGTEPYYSTSAVNLSPDVKLYDLSGLEVAAPECGVTYNIKVTVRNNTDQPISFNRNQLKIHWLARYSSPVWKSSWTSAGSLCGIPLSGTLSFSPFVATINANSSYTITKQWTAPALNTCVRPPYSTPLHIVAVMDDGFLTIGEDDTQFPLEQFVKTNNNVAWHQYTLSYDDVVPIILSISPNPANGQAVVNYRLGDNTRSGMSLVVASASGERVVSIPVSDSEGSATIDLQFLPGGHYVVQLVSSNRVLDAKPLVVE